MDSYINILTAVECANSYKVRFEAIHQPDELRDCIFVKSVDNPSRTDNFYIYPTLDSNREIVKKANKAAANVLRGK